MTVRAILSDPDYPRLKEHVLHHTGLAYYADKDEDLATRISRRFAVVKAPSCTAYLALLNRTRTATIPPEIDALVGELTIGETYFFRQAEHFELLRSAIIPDLLRRKNNSRELRVWSAGCATGAEPYSVAVLLYTEFAGSIRAWDVSILGTDINPDFLAQARTGNFSEWALRDVSAEVKHCCFHQEGKRWILAPQFRKAVTFRYHNLNDDGTSPSPDNRPFDLILCRNVMIYFSQDRNRAVTAEFFAQLSDGGWLLVGHAESNVELFQQFQPVHGGGVTAYRKMLSGQGAAPVRSSPPVWLPWTPTVPGAPLEGAAPVNLAPLQASLPAVLEDARMLADRGEWNAAQAICQTLIANDPLDAPAHFTLGLILAHKRSLETAIAELRRAIYVDRRFALAHYYLGTLLQSTGCAPEARKAFRNASAMLHQRPADESVEHSDGMKVEELRELTRMHQEILGE